MTASLSPLAQHIVDYLQENPGVVDVVRLRESAREQGHTLTQFNEAMRELKAAKLADYCDSCRSFISPSTTHSGGCPHGA